jgi:hypothetical protein
LALKDGREIHVEKHKKLQRASMANLSLGGTTRNITPQNFVTHPTSGQHRTHIKNKFIPNYLSKGYSSHVEFKTFIKFTKKCVLIWKMNV